MDYKEMFNKLYAELSNKESSLDNAYMCEAISRFNNGIHNSLTDCIFEYWWEEQLESMDYISMMALNKTERDAAKVVSKTMNDIYDEHYKEAIK